jgi:hypothetical protein
VNIAAIVPGCEHVPSPPSTAAEIGTRRGWNVILAEPCTDTLTVPWRTVFPAAERTFKADNWQIESKDPRNGAIVTTWKPIRHPLVRLFAGKIEARCAVNVTPLGPSRTLVVFQGGIASRDEIEHSPAMGFAKHAYQKASRRWQEKLRADILRNQAPRASKP